MFVRVRVCVLRLCVCVCVCNELWFPRSATNSRVGVYVLGCARVSGTCALRAVVSTLCYVVSAVVSTLCNEVFCWFVCVGVCVRVSGMCALRAVVSTLCNVASCRFVCVHMLPVS